MTIKLKYSDEPIEVTGMSFDEEGVFKGYFKEGDPAAPVKLDEFYPKEGCDVIGRKVYAPADLTPTDMSQIVGFYHDCLNEQLETGKFLSDRQQYNEVLRRYLQAKNNQFLDTIISLHNK